MGSATPPKRMTRSRAAAASASAATLAPQATASDRVSKSTKAPKATKATAATAKKPAAAKKTVAAAAKKSTAKKSVTAKKSTTTKTTAAKTTAIASTSTSISTSASASTSTSIDTTAAPAMTRKRKLRAHDSDDDDEDDLSKDDNTHPIMSRPAKKLRGSAKKAADTESESESESQSVPRSKQQPKPKAKDTQSTPAIPATRSTRGRPKKSTATSSTAPTVDTQTSSTTTRTRARKTTTKVDDVAPTSKQPAAKATRGRKASGTVTTTYTTEPTPGLKSAVSRPASKPSGVLKKTVTFEEPERETKLLAAATKAKTETAGTSATGMRAKPVRKPGASGRTTRASARAATTETTEKKPLSPKKDGQNLPLSRDLGSDDELATYEKTPLKALMKSPVKPKTGVKKLELPSLEKEKDENSPPSLEPTHSSVFGSPARRPPTSPFKDAMKSPAKRVDAVPSLILSSTSTEAQTSQSPSKSTMLQSPAKRPHMPLPAFPLNQDQAGANRSPTKLSLLNTPAKRPSSPKKLLSSPSPQIEYEPKEVDQTSMGEISEEELQSQIRAENEVVSPPEPTLMMKALTPIQEDDNEDSIGLESPTPQLAFPGRLSAVLPRHADPALKQNPLPALSVSSLQSSGLEEQKSEAVAVNGSSKNGLEGETPVGDGSDVCKAMPEEQHNDLCGVEPHGGCISLPETEITDSSKEGITVNTSEQPVGLCEVETQEQHMNMSAADSIEKSSDTCEPKSEPQSIDEDECSTEEQTAISAGQVTQSQATPKRAGFGSRVKDREGDTISDSEDELAFSNKTVTKHKDSARILGTPVATPGPLKIPESVASRVRKAIKSAHQGPGYVYTAQLRDWRNSSPVKNRQAQQKPDSQVEDVENEYSLVEINDSPTVETSAPKGFFDDEMRIRDEMETQAAMEAALEADIAAKFDKHDFNDLGLMSDDLSVVTEDGGMSLINNPESDQSHLHDKSTSGANQQHDNESSVPIDPALINNGANVQTTSHPPVTPKRTFASREVHTVSKVPLKRGDDSPPRNVKRLCSTASKAALERPRIDLEEQTGESKLALATPSKVGTPGRVARPDINPDLLRGVIALVDVHTTEGTDAGRIFVDLLVAMGAKCVKSWNWNPAGFTGGPGITHVVFKDGGKRTLEKVVESNGRVRCVGVSWVLDCEKENRRLGEKDYRVDTSLIPRGGRNRRKSMEPKAIANVNGTLVTPVKSILGPSREPQTVPNNYMSRRDSTLWERSPSEHDEDEDAPSEPSEMDWESTDTILMSPIPQTPAPEAVARFALDVSPGTPTIGFNPSAGNNQMAVQTLPPRPSAHINIGEPLALNQDPLQVRLAKARRKSMPHEPKVSSPLKKQWTPMD
ncbi:hypothetical protein F5Y10DRAFT_184804 [Nemania abortiva]|nr:hypothetical protein F5Y10DRAFT_184804 [Nemania abortiva]